MCKDILFSKLILLLKEEISLSRRLEELLEQEKEYLVQGSMRLFEETVSLKIATVDELCCLEKKRLELMVTLNAELALNGQESTLKKLIRSASPLHQNILSEIRTQYRRLLKRISEANQRNNILLRNSIQYVEYTLNLVTRSKDTTYAKSGKMQYLERKLVNRVI